MIIGIDASRANLIERTGTERYSFELISRWPRLRPDLHFRLYLREAPLADLRDLGPNVEIRVLAWLPRILWNLLRLSWEMLWHPPDVLFVPAHTSPLIHPRHTVVTIHDVGFERFPELYSHTPIGSRKNWLRVFIRAATLGKYGNSELDYHRFAVRWALRTASRIITISKFSAAEILNYFPYDARKLAVIPLGVTPRPRSSEPSPLPNPYTMFVGRLERKKNIANLVAAYAQYRTLTPNPVDLVLIGRPGTGFDEAKKIIAARGLRDVVHQFPWQPAPAIDRFLTHARSFVFVSRYEGFGLPAIEAMAAGVPVLASTAGSLPEVCADAAILVDPERVDDIAQGLLAVNHDEPRRAELVEQGRRRAAEFSWDRCAEQTLELLLSEGNVDLQNTAKIGTV